jgi:NTP pyrophosphatase (non-canonical NTP hydrolase)
MSAVSQIAIDWAVRCFGAKQVFNRKHRVLRFLEEAIELAQAVGLEKEKAAKVLDVVYSRPAGTMSQELGGVALTLDIFLTLEAATYDGMLEQEIIRVLAKPVKHFAKRNEEKDNLGLKP